METNRAKGVVGGLLFTALGALTVIAARDYTVGTPANMGPGFFPVVLGALLCLLGLLSAGAAWRGTAAVETEPARLGRSLMLPLGILIFGLLVERAGVVIATLALVGCVWMTGYGFKVWEILLVAVVLVAIACGLFVYGLQLPTTYLLPF